MKIEQFNRNLLLFMVIGDGHIDKRGYFDVVHCEKQKDYIEWKHRLLKNNKISVSEISSFNNNGFKAYRFRTKTYRFLKLYRKVLYKPKKTITRKLLNKLNILGLAIWYMDDGGLSQKKKNGVVHANDLILNTHISKEENQIIIDYFKEVWNINFTQVKNKNQYRLRCGTKEARKFIELIEPIVSKIPSMKHKLNIKK